MNDIETILKQLAELAAETAEQLAPLVQASDRHIGPMGGVIVLPTATERATALRSKADALRQLCDIPLPTQGLEE